MIDGKAKHSPTNDWDTNAVWVDARRAMTATHRSDTQNHKTRHVKKRKKTGKPREGWEDGTPPPHRDFKERSVVLAVDHPTHTHSPPLGVCLLARTKPSLREQRHFSENTSLVHEVH